MIDDRKTDRLEIDKMSLEVMYLSFFFFFGTGHRAYLFPDSLILVSFIYLCHVSSLTDMSRLFAEIM